MKVGYASVSTKDSSLSMQNDALKKQVSETVLIEI
jgi:DNA invertase Pin-like site-specific DNA recombinase